MYKNKTMISIILILAILTSSLLGGCSRNGNDGDIWGRADAKEIDINSKISGRVVKLLVEEGQHVAKGDVIARIDASDIISYNVKVQLDTASVRPGMRFKLLGDAAE